LNTLLPIFMKIKFEPCLIVGGGKIALQKARQLIEAEADITIVAPNLIPGFDVLKITHTSTNYERKHIAGKKLVIAATNDSEINRKVYQDAVALNIPVNVVDEPELCSFYMGSVYQDGDLKIAVSTNGTCPSFGQYVRDHIKSVSRGIWGKSLAKLALHRKRVIQSITDYSKKQQIISQLVAKEEAFHNYSSKKQGKVFIVGAGPGDPELITVKGYHAIKNADIILHDALIHPHLVFEVNPLAEKIFVGKRNGKHSVSQKEIQSILIEEVNKGRQVVRLKGGDPFIFGRGGEEAIALAGENIPFEVIAGVTAGIGAAAGYGIPLTSRKEANKTLFITGHQCDRKGEHDWKKLATLDATLVFYMGLKRIDDIINGLTQNKMSLYTPIAIIQNATLINQQILTSTLGEIKNKLSKDEVKTPAIIIIGEVVNHHENIQSCIDNLPAGVLRPLESSGFDFWQGEFIEA
jgi:uroporphyrin-III C-methyltransferase/precorrin-2 dehydrogenase/sirohydrochlorin ferrochelatase